jgi:hypothetical protein
LTEADQRRCSAGRGGALVAARRSQARMMLWRTDFDEEEP